MQTHRLSLWLVLLLALALTGCPDDGGDVDLCGNPDLVCDDSSACTEDSCDPVLGCVNDPISCTDANACTAESCDPAIGCVSTPVSCNDGNLCTSDECDSVIGCINTDISASCDDGSACTVDSCNPALGCVNALINCDDGNPCTADSCRSATGCRSLPVADGAPCNAGLGQCLAGICEPVDCFDDQGCDDSNACTADQCNLETNACVHVDTSEACDDGNACTADSCAPSTGCSNLDVSASCDDVNDCTTDSCEPAIGCVAENAANGTPCAGGAGMCSAGICQLQSVEEYEQDFESLDADDPTALGDDDWLVFGNVFDGTTMALLYGYGPNPAPNDGAAFSAIVSGQGGAEQGDQQLSVYSDYNNTDHANGNLIESTVYRERPITAADVGRTIRFAFDAKRGNINDPQDPLCPCSSTATGFIKTLDPTAGFATTNLVSEDTTALPEAWNRYELSLPIDAGLVGQLLQVGFTATATNYEPSGNLYDNVVVTSGPPLP